MYRRGAFNNDAMDNAMPMAARNNFAPNERAVGIADA
jgi:hypothetical protein